MSQRGGKLEDIRARINAMDAEIHALLMRRGRLIAELQQAKGVGGPAGTSAMRPAREAQMMRALAARHKGEFPFAAAERIWREIIASFTQLQAPFRVVLTGASDALLMEAGRFYFGVTAPLSIAANAQDVLDEIAAHDDVAGVIMGELDGSDWWARLAAASNHAGHHPGRIVARLPFFAEQDTTAAWRRTGYVLSRAAFEPSGMDKTLAVASDGDAESATASSRIVATAILSGRTHSLVELDGHVADDRLPRSFKPIGGYGCYNATLKV